MIAVAVAACVGACGGAVAEREAPDEQQSRAVADDDSANAEGADAATATAAHDGATTCKTKLTGSLYSLCPYGFAAVGVQTTCRIPEPLEDAGRMPLLEPAFCAEVCTVVAAPPLHDHDSGLVFFPDGGACRLGFRPGEVLCVVQGC